MYIYTYVYMYMYVFTSTYICTCLFSSHEYQTLPAGLLQQRRRHGARPRPRLGDVLGAGGGMAAFGFPAVKPRMKMYMYLYFVA